MTKTPMEEIMEEIEYAKIKDLDGLLMQSTSRKEERIKCMKEELVREVFRLGRMNVILKDWKDKSKLSIIRNIDYELEECRNRISFLKSELKLGEKT